MTGDWYYLSFADSERPKGTQFLGACIVGPAEDFIAAVKLAHALGCNPGGEVLGHEVPAETALRVPLGDRRRLLTREEIEALGAYLDEFRR